MGCPGEPIARPSSGESLKMEQRQYMVPDFEEQFRSRILLEIGHPSADQLEWRAAEFRQVKSKRNLALKPWFYRVPIA